MGIEFLIKKIHTSDAQAPSTLSTERAEQDMYSALTSRKQFLEDQLVEKREVLNELCLRIAVSFSCLTSLLHVC